MAYIPNSYFTSKISNFDNYSNYNVNREFYFFQNGKDIIDSKFNFYNGKNLSSNENILIFHENNLMKDKGFIIYININDLEIKVDSVSNIIKTKILSTILFKEEINTQKVCNASIQMAFPLVVTNFSAIYDNKIYNLNISTIDNNTNNFDLIIASPCLELNIIISLFKNENFFSKEFIIYNSIIIAFSIINIIYLLKFYFSIKKNQSLIKAFSKNFLIYNYFFYFLFLYLSISLYTTYRKSYLEIKVMNLIGMLFLTANIFFLLLTLFKTKQKSRKNCAFVIISIIICLIIGFFIVYCFSFEYPIKRDIILLIMLSIMWTIQITYNIIHNNKYIYPLFYIIICSIDKFVFTMLISSSISVIKIIIPSLIILINIIIMFLQGFLGPRFMLCNKYEENRPLFYKTKIELLNLYPNSKDEKCSICISPLINQKKEDIKNNENKNVIKSEITNDNVSKNDKDDKGTIVIEFDNSCDTNDKIKTSKNKLKEKSKNKNIEIDSKNNIIKNNSTETKPEVIKESNNKIDENKNIWNNIKNIIQFVFLDFYISKSEKPEFYMVIPCGHYFHSKCLENWLQTNKICPLCRQNVPDSL